MSPDELFHPPNPAPVAIGTGLVALDVIIRKGSERQLRLRPGGTCGNVLGILAYLGWMSHPAIRIGADPAADLIVRDLSMRGVSLDLVLQDPSVDTPVIIHRITRTASDGAVHSYSNRCPSCKSFLPGYRPLLASSAQEIVGSLAPTQLFFFDRVSRASIVLANACAEMGALVVFEPSSIKDPDLFEEAVSISHILKYSGDRLGDASLSKYRGPLLTIETNGVRGLRYRSTLPHATAKKWVSLPAFPAPIVRDAAGSGDWCTAGLLHWLGRLGHSAFLKANTWELEDAIRFGQALAALNCAHEGALGAINDLDRNTFRTRALNILEGGIDEPDEEPEEDSALPADSSFCLVCRSSPSYATS